MATSTITTITDDISGEPDAASVSFTLDGVAYSIDLAPANRARLREALEPFIAAGRREAKNGAVVRLANRPSTARGHDPAAIRTWAAGAGVDVADRGRIPTAIVAEYERYLAGAWTPPRKSKARKAPEPATEAS